MSYGVLIRPLLFLAPPEGAHRLVISVLQFLSAVLRAVRWVRRASDPALALSLWDLHFDNPIGLAAGFDKDARAYEALGALGFGCVEVGTLTAQSQPGNPRPRLFRLPQDRALINRLGFNNRGARAAAARIRPRSKRTVRLGVNIGKTRTISAAQAAEDYAYSTRLLAPLADYLVVNVSSPNTPGLRELQAAVNLRPLLVRVQAEIRAVTDRAVPLLVKIAPELSDDEVDAVADLCLELSVAGIVAVNTSSGRTGLRSPPGPVAEYGSGGLSGPVLRTRALAILRRLRARVGDKLVLVSVGGIETADDVWERLAAGASLVQLYTALIYEGPGLPARLCRDLGQRLRAEGLSSVSELIGRNSPVQLSSLTP